jgi:hypothetical protein
MRRVLLIFNPLLVQMGPIFLDLNLRPIGTKFLGPIFRGTRSAVDGTICLLRTTVSPASSRVDLGLVLMRSVRRFCGSRISMGSRLFRAISRLRLARAVTLLRFGRSLLLRNDMAARSFVAKLDRLSRDCAGA